MSQLELPAENQNTPLFGSVFGLSKCSKCPHSHFCRCSQARETFFDMVSLLSRPAIAPSPPSLQSTYPAGSPPKVALPATTFHLRGTACLYWRGSNPLRFLFLCRLAFVSPVLMFRQRPLKALSPTQIWGSLTLGRVIPWPKTQTTIPPSLSACAARP